MYTRHLTFEDQNAFARMLASYFRDDLKKDWPEEIIRERIAGLILKQYEDGLIRILLAFQQETPVGFAVYQFDSANSDWCKRPGWGFIREFHISRPFRAAGFGRFLAAETERCLRDTGAENVYLTTSEALPFWLRCGYSPEEIPVSDGMHSLSKKLME